MIKYLISNMSFFLECMILSPVVMMLDIIIPNLRKLSCFVCVTDIVLPFSVVLKYLLYDRSVIFYSYRHILIRASLSPH